jgi:hypothetical protein
VTCFLEVSVPKPYMHLLNLPYVPHAPPISQFMFNHADGTGEEYKSWKSHCAISCSPLISDTVLSLNNR